MKLETVMIAWNTMSEPLAGRTRGAVKVGIWPDETGWSDGFDRTDGMCMANWHRASPDLRKALLFILFNTLVVRDGLDPAIVHEAFLAIEEYRRSIPLDQSGAEE